MNAAHNMTVSGNQGRKAHVAKSNKMCSIVPAFWPGEMSIVCVCVCEFPWAIWRQALSVLRHTQMVLNMIS